MKEYEINSDTLLNSVSYFNTFGNVDSVRYSPSRIWKYYYDNKNRCVLETWGAVREETSYFNNLIVEKHYQDSVLVTMTKHYFNSKCQLDSSVIFNSPFITAYRKFLLKYDDQNRPIEECDVLWHITHKYFYSNEKIIRQISYFFDYYDICNFNSFGDIIENNRYLSNDSIIFETNYSYKYDNYNNWIQREEIESFKDKKLKTLLMRKIEYY